MRINKFITESFQTVSINGILYSLTTDEKKIYSKVKESGKLLKSDLDEFDARVANGMVTKGLLKRRKNPQHEIYFVTKGRRKSALNKPIEEVAPPDTQIEKWINDNKERFEKQYGKDYKKYLYGKAWNKFNGKKMLDESITYRGEVFDIEYDIPYAMNFEVEVDNENELYDSIANMIRDSSGVNVNDFSYTVSDYESDNDENNDENNNENNNENNVPSDYWDGEDDEESVQRLDERVHYDVHVYDIDWNIPSDRQDVEFNLDDYEDANSEYLYDTIRDRVADEVGFYPASFSFDINGVYDEDGNPYNADSEDDNSQDSENDLPSDYWDGDSEEEIIESIFQEAYMQLNEGVEDVKRYFPKITNEDFTKLINLDPTYKGGNELGKYGKWILGLYNTFLKDKESYAKWEEQKKLGNNFPEPTRKSQEQIEDFDKIHAILKDFDVMNTKLKVNINNVKSVAELYKIVNDAKNEGISNNSKVNHVIDLVKKSVEKGGEVVFKDSNWIVLIPKTLESSVIFGSDTNWCTTASNGERYEYYKKEYGGEYYINVNLKDGSLYQFHFESEQFMDKNDDPIRILDFLNGNMSLFSFYKKHFGSSLIGKTTCGIMFVDNPSEEMQLEAVKQNWYAIVYIKNPSEAVQLEAVKKHGSVIQYIKNPSEAVQLIAVKKNGHGIKYIKNPSEAVQLIAVGQFSDTIKYIKNPSETVQLAAVKGNGYSIRYIKNPSEQVQIKAVEYIADVIEYIKNPSEAVQLAAVKANKKALQYIQNPTPAVIKAAKKRKRKSSSSMNESAGSKDELDFYKRFEGTEVEAKDDGEVFTIVDVEHDGFGIRLKLESNESDTQIIVELDEMDKHFTGFKPFENEEYWDGED